MKIKIEKLYIKDKVSKAGKPYKSLSIFANGTYYNGFAGQWNAHWKIGDEVEIDAEPFGEYQGQTTYSIKSPPRGTTPQQPANNAVLEKIELILAKQDQILKKLEDKEMDSML